MVGFEILTSKKVRAAKNFIKKNKITGRADTLYWALAHFGENCNKVQFEVTGPLKAQLNVFYQNSFLPKIMFFWSCDINFFFAIFS